MFKVKWLALLSLILALPFVYGGCGGAGTSDPISYVLVRVECPGQDPINIEVGMVVQFVLAGYDASFNRYVVTAESWSMTNVTGAPGTLNASGQFTATGTGTARIVGTFTGYTVQNLDIVVRPVQARVSGSVRASTNGAGIPSVWVRFYNASDVLVGEAITNSSGTFLASVPTTATKVNLRADNLPSGWYKEWVYRNVRYSATISGCHAVMVLNVPLANGQTSTMADPIFLDSTVNPPPPPPDGCS